MTTDKNDFKKIFNIVEGIRKSFDIPANTIAVKALKIFRYCDIMQNVSMCMNEGNNAYICVVEEGTNFMLAQIIRTGAVLTLKTSIVLMMVPTGFNQVLAMGGIGYGTKLLMDSSKLSRQATKYTFAQIHNYFTPKAKFHTPKIISTEIKNNCVKMTVRAKNAKNAKQFAMNYFNTKIKNNNCQLDRARKIFIDSMVEDMKIVSNIRDNIGNKTRQIKFLLKNVEHIDTKLLFDDSDVFYEENKTDYYVGEQRKYYLNEIFHRSIVEKPPPPTPPRGYMFSGTNGGGKGGFDFLILIPIVTFSTSSCCIS
jgi:hypothetical protein